MLDDEKSTPIARALEGAMRQYFAHLHQVHDCTSIPNPYIRRLVADQLRYDMVFVD